MTGAPTFLKLVPLENAMRTERLIIYANAAWLTALGVAFALWPSTLPAWAGDYATSATFRVLGVSLGGIGLGLLFLGRLTDPRDRRRFALALFGADVAIGAVGLLSLGGAWGSGLAALAAPAQLLLGAGFLALVRSADTPKSRRSFGTLVIVQGILIFLLGYGLVSARVSGTQIAPSIRFLGIELAGLGLALGVAGNPAGTDARRRLLLGLSLGAATAALMTIIQETQIWLSGSWGWGLSLIPLGLAFGLGWAGLRPEAPAGGEARVRQEIALRLAGSHLLVGLGAAAFGLGATALRLPSWAVLALAATVAGILGSLITHGLHGLQGPRQDGLYAALLENGASPQALLQVREEGAEEERKRLARDLHDSIKQQIFTIQVSAAAAQARWESDPEGARVAVADVRRGAQEAMAEMRALLQQLRPRALAGPGLVEALREQCEALGYRTGSEVSLEIGEPIPGDRLPAGAQETLFRIAQEALSNVARHARAHRVRVHLGRQGEEACLRVEDDGQGFSPEARSAGMGLRNLEERTEALHGHLEISSEPGKGAWIQVRVPLTSPAADEAPLVQDIRNQRKLLLRALPGFALLLAAPWMGPKLVAYVVGAAVGLFLLGVLESGVRIHEAMRRLDGGEPGPASRLLYLGRRTRAILLLGFAWALTPIAQGVQGGWGVFWSAGMLLAIAGAAREILLAHRGSQLRRGSPSWVWPQGWERSGRSIAFLVSFACLLGFSALLLAEETLSRPTSPRSLFPLATALVAVYFHLRQPRAEGAPS